jgi:nucleotide-binding universal stress UspA family protein
MIQLSRILCPIDFSEFSEHALAHAIKIAGWYGALLQVLHVLPPSSTSIELTASRHEITARQLRDIVARHRQPDVVVETKIVDSADPPRCILECAETLDADLIVTGSHGHRGMQRVLLGSVVEALLHQAVRPILVVPVNLKSTPTSEATFSRIVCPVDFGTASLNALAFARSLAEESDARLTLLHVIDTPPELSHAPQPLDRYVAPLRAAARATAQEQMQQLLPQHATDHGRVETAVVEGHVSRRVLEIAAERQADLIVMGVHGRHAFDLAIFGSNSMDVIQQATCPVLIVPVVS